MKINTKQYARALYELTKEKSEKDVDVVIKKFVNDLKKNGMLDKVEEIIGKFTEIYNHKNGIIKAKVFVKDVLTPEEAKRIEQFVKEEYGAKEVELTVVKDDKLKGGIKIIVGEDILDRSISGKLTKLRGALV
jgi:F-type H+-transporting ATPase subunit delta